MLQTLLSELILWLQGENSVKGNYFNGNLALDANHCVFVCVCVCLIHLSFLDRH